MLVAENLKLDHARAFRIPPIGWRRVFLDVWATSLALRPARRCFGGGANESQA